jgi:hypothetical protein
MTKQNVTLLASSPTFEGIKASVEKFFFGEISLDDDMNFIRISHGAADEKVPSKDEMRIKTKKQRGITRYRFEMIH